MRETNAGPILDDTKASVARVYDLSLGGKDNYEVDRVVWEQITAVAPHQGDVSKAHRRWLTRAVEYLADDIGIQQFLDLGSGLPTMENTHEVAQRHRPEVKVVYVDNDPVVTAHGRALLEENDRTIFLEADFTRPAEILEAREVHDFLDLTRPTAIMQCGTLHHVPDLDDAVAIMRQLSDALPSGSHFVISHFWDPDDENPELHELARNMEETFTRSGMGSGWWRTREEIAQLFVGAEILEPGLVELDEWWPSGPKVRTPWPEERVILGGVGRKP